MSGPFIRLTETIINREFAINMAHVVRMEPSLGSSGTTLHLTQDASPEQKPIYVTESMNEVLARLAIAQG